MTKVNYDKFANFDLNEACDHFDCEDQKQWKKIGKFIVADGQEYVEVMEKEFDFEDTADSEYAAFEASLEASASAEKPPASPPKSVAPLSTWNAFVNGVILAKVTVNSKIPA